GGAELHTELIRLWPSMDARAATAPVLERAGALLGRPIIGAGRGGASDAAHFASAIPVTVDGLGPRGGGAHAPHEYVLRASLWATAMTPVIVALVKEALERPAQRVREVSVVGRRQSGEELVVEEVEPPTAAGAPPEPAGYRTYGIRRKHWKDAIVTGLLAFVL